MRGNFIARALDGQRGHLLPWAPAGLGAGIGLYFALPAEPDPAVLAAAAAGAAAFFLTGWRLRAGAGPLLVLMALVLAGLVLGAARARQVAAPVIEGRYYGPVGGRIVAIDRSGSDRLRLTLDNVRLSGRAGENTPARVRISVGAGVRHTDFLVGRRVMTTAHLSPPPGPAEPGGFDFRRHAWFLRLGAVGYTNVPVLAVGIGSDGRSAVALGPLRQAIADRVRANVAGREGAFAAAIVVGDRSGLDGATLDALRRTNLAHLLAISGLHMGLVAGFVFALVRLVIAAAPPLALRLPGHRIAAVAALLAGAGYLALSGGSVATERAFIMAAVMLGGVMLDRRALSLRAVAVAALCVLLLRPESLLSPGFQMSFAATAALVAVFSALRERGTPRVPGPLRIIAATALSSFVAGLATAPFAAAHFNQISHYGLLANIVSVPVMGLLVMPAAVVAVALMPFGLAGPAFWVMGQGIGWILGVADRVSAWPGAVSPVVAPGAAVLPLVALGGLWIVLWRGRGRLAGVVPVVAALALWAATERPLVLISDTGRLVGVLTEAGRALSRARGEGFVAGIWLENDGFAMSQAEAAALWPDRPSPGVAVWRDGDLSLVHLSGRRAPLPEAACGWGAVIIADRPIGVEGPCLVLDSERLAHSGAVAIGRSGLGLSVVTARETVGRRPWSPPARTAARGQ